MKYNVDVWTMIQMTLTRIVKVLEFTVIITQTSRIQNIVIDTIKEWGYKEHLHFGHTLPDVTVIQVSHNVDLLLVNAKLGQIMRIIEINICLLETLFILSIQIFKGQYFLYEGCKLIAFHMSLQCLSMPREDSKIDFFPRNVLWTFRWDLLPRNVNTWKSLKSIFFQILGLICFRLSKVRNREPAPWGWAYFRLSSSEDMPCLSRATNEVSTVLTQSNSRGCFWQKCQERKEL